MAAIPTLDIRRYDSDRSAFVGELGGACHEYGFCCIAGHGIPRGLIAAAYAAFVQFFALPVATKMKYHQPGTGGARAYTPFGLETAKDSSYADLKEFWHIGREIQRDSKFADIMAANVWPEEIPGFREAACALYAALDDLGSRVLCALALHLDLPEDYFAGRTDSGNSILRPIHYPPIPDGDLPNIRAGAHEDINLITLLVGASAEGLQVRSRSGDWLPVTTSADAIVVNVGDMLQRLTNHVYPSATHRVVNPPGATADMARYSVPFFLHPNPDVSLAVLPSCASADNPSRYPEPITANEYLLQRLREIKLL
ncbi:MAG: 2-oxoglutarate and iron-dependent oxygenase domain-containing protein [Dokdonella sp.]